MIFEGRGGGGGGGGEERWKILKKFCNMHNKLHSLQKQTPQPRREGNEASAFGGYKLYIMHAFRLKMIFVLFFRGKIILARLKSEQIFQPPSPLKKSNGPSLRLFDLPSQSFTQLMLSLPALANPVKNDSSISPYRANHEQL